MAITREWTFWCDHTTRDEDGEEHQCPEWTQVAEYLVARARLVAKRRGWQVSRVHGVRCPAHARKVSPPSE